MKTLKGLTFAAAPAASKSPVVLRRAKLIAHLHQQKQLAENPAHLKTIQKWVVQDNGVKAPVEISRRVQPWWRIDESGQIFLKVRYGAKAIEFEKGKAAILIKDKSKLIATLDTLISAINAGELDEQLAAQATERPFAKAKQQTSS
jgi:hypothetical protein